VDAVKKQAGDRVMRFPIMLEQTETGFAVQAPDLAIATYGENIEAAKRAASEAIRINLEAYREAGQQAPERQSVSNHLENPEFRDLLFTDPARMQSMAKTLTADDILPLVASLTPQERVRLLRLIALPQGGTRPFTGPYHLHATSFRRTRSRLLGTQRAGRMWGEAW
jgi:predicted RNase H-like HicB family nuclease